MNERTSLRFSASTILSHNGMLTISNPTTGQHRTFRINTQPADSSFAPGRRMISLLTGSDNHLDYKGFAWVNGDGVALWRRYRESGTFRAYVRMLAKPEHYQSLGIEYEFEGRCRICNRILTNPESIQSGIGPVCAQHN